MEYKRIIYFGFTDYSIATLDLIMNDMKADYIPRMQLTISKLKVLMKAVKANMNRLKDPDEIINYIGFWITLFQGFEFDLKRVLDEMPNGIEDRHADIIYQICERSILEEKNTNREFKREFIIGLDFEEVAIHSLLSAIYRTSGDQLVSNKNLGSLANRLRTFVGTQQDTQKSISEFREKDQSKKLKMLFPTPKGITWEDISIRFLDEDEVEVRAGKVTMVRNFIQMGFEFRDTERPDKIWETLKEFAEQEGVLTWDIPTIERSEAEKHKRRISDLRKRLKDYFGIDENPIPDYRTTHSYKTRFRVHRVRVV